MCPGDGFKTFTFFIMRRYANRKLHRIIDLQRVFFRIIKIWCKQFAAYRLLEIQLGLDRKTCAAHFITNDCLPPIYSFLRDTRDQLLDGADFAEIARIYSIDTSSRPAGGDLGWFPAGYLLVPEVEAAAFDIQPGELSEVIESELGFHIVQTIERGERPLAPDALRQLREEAVMDWLGAQREVAEVQILIAP